MLLAAPGPVMSGVLVDAMGDEQQKKWFYSRIMEKPTWTFFALTEPDRGSDAGAMNTTLTPDGDDHFVLRGAKRYIGNAARADLGIVFARTRPGPLGVTAVLTETSIAGFTAEPLETIGLRGLRITAVTLDDVRVPAGQVLGRHLRATQRGMWSAVQGLNRLRPGVAAFGLGIARAAYEYILDNRRALNTAERHRIDRLGLRLTELRQLIWRSAIAVDDNDPAMRLPGVGGEGTCLAPRRGGDTRSARLLRPRRPPGPSPAGQARPGRPGCGVHGGNRQHPEAQPVHRPGPGTSPP